MFQLLQPTSLFLQWIFIGVQTNTFLPMPFVIKCIQICFNQDCGAGVQTIFDDWSWSRCQTKLLTCKISDFTPSAHAESDTLHQGFPNCGLRSVSRPFDGDWRTSSASQRFILHPKVFILKSGAFSRTSGATPRQLYEWLLIKLLFSYIAAHRVGLVIITWLLFRHNCLTIPRNYRVYTGENSGFKIRKKRWNLLSKTMELYKFTSVQSWKIVEKGRNFAEILVLWEGNFIFSREVNKTWSKAKVYSAFLGNDKERETFRFLADIVQHLNDFNIKLQEEKRTTLDLITTMRPFQKTFDIFKHVLQNELSRFPSHFGESKSKKIPDIFTLLKRWLSTLPNFGDFSFWKQLLLLPQNPL